MRNVRTAFLVGATAMGLAGLSGVAAARDLSTHVMTVEIPGGGLAEIRYAGDVPPQVVYEPVPAGVSALAPFGAFFPPAPPFAELERISAAMDREAASLMRRAEMLPWVPGLAPNQPLNAVVGSLPPGTASFTMISTWSGNGVCTQSVEITTPANGGTPRAVSHSSGNCGSTPGPIGTPAIPGPTHRLEILETGVNGNSPYPGLVREAAWQH